MRCRMKIPSVLRAAVTAFESIGSTETVLSGVGGSGVFGISGAEGVRLSEETSESEVDSRVPDAGGVEIMFAR